MRELGNRIVEVLESEQTSFSSVSDDPKRITKGDKVASSKTVMIPDSADSSEAAGTDAIDIGTVLESLETSHAGTVSGEGDSAVTTFAPFTVPADALLVALSADGSTVHGFFTLAEGTEATFAPLPAWRTFRKGGDLLAAIGKRAKVEASDLADIEAAAKLRAKLEAVEAKLAAKRAKRGDIAAQLAEVDADIAASTAEAFSAADADGEVSA